MGPSWWQRKSTQFLPVTVVGAGLICSVLPGASTLLAQDAKPSSTASNQQQIKAPNATATLPGQTQGSATAGTISGTVLDVTGVPVSKAKVRLTHAAATPERVCVTADNGQFSFSDTAPGPFEISVSLAGFKTKNVTGTLPEAEDRLVPAITLDPAPVVTNVSVQLTTEEIAAEQIKEQEQQRLLAVVPNFYTSYAQDAAPMTAKQKFALAWRQVIDPVNILIPAIIAGGEQANNSFPGYGQGASGYFNRFGAAYGDFFIGTYMSSAILPAVFKQDPRYFYKGTGTVKSRVLYALSRSVMAKGDNGRWQPDYSGILGSMAAGAISNLYYPDGSRHGFETTLDNTLIGIGTSAGVNLLQEFVFPKITPKMPKKSPPKS